MDALEFHLLQSGGLTTPLLQGDPPGPSGADGNIALDLLPDLPQKC
jgi:hypothetical protein